MAIKRPTAFLPIYVCSVLIATLLIWGRATAQAPKRDGARGQGPGGRARSAFTWPLAPGASIVAPSGVTPAAGPILPVIGGGTFGRITKWTGFGTNSVIGDSTIFEDKLGKVGIGTDLPTSRLTVAGMITVAGTIQAS